MSTVTVIVPIYKAELYLEKCIQSIIEQTYEDLEILLLNDGSPDNCLRICQSFQAMDKRIRVIDKENTGVSDTRNQGLDIATGKYVMFVDSDDYLEKDMIRLLVSQIEKDNADLAMCGFIEKNRDVEKHVNPLEEAGCYSRDIFVKGIIKNPYSLLYGVLWNKLYKTEMIGSEIRFPSDMNYGEDFSFNLMYIAKIEKIAVIHANLYNYVRYNDNSLMYRQAKEISDYNGYIEYLAKRVKIYNQYKKFFCEINLYQEYSNEVNEYIYRLIVSEKINLLFSDRKRAEKRAILQWMKKNPEMSEAVEEMQLLYKWKRRIPITLLSMKAVLRNKIIRN